MSGITETLRDKLRFGHRDAHRADGMQGDHVDATQQHEEVPTGARNASGADSGKNPSDSTPSKEAGAQPPCNNILTLSCMMLMHAIPNHTLKGTVGWVV